MTTKIDDGTAEFAAEQAVDWAARAWFRRTKNENGNGGELALAIVDNVRSHITPEQWRELGGLKN